jgi:hypothetical protein
MRSQREPGKRGGQAMMLASGLFVPQLVTRDPESGEFTSVEGPKGVGGGGGGGALPGSAG